MAVKCWLLCYVKEVWSNSYFIKKKTNSELTANFLPNSFSVSREMIIFLLHF